MDSKLIWQEFRQKLKYFIRSRVRTEHDAEDVLQDVFVKIHEKLPTLKNYERLEPWLFQITRNTITDYYRQSRLTLEFKEDSTAFVTENDDDLDSAFKDLSACIKPLLHQLPEKYRHALEATNYQGQTQQALADDLGLSLSAAKSRVQRARKQLKTGLLTCCHVEFDHLGNVSDFNKKKSSCELCS